MLKGITEVSYAGQPLLAAEMVLIRLAHAADVPSGEDLLNWQSKLACRKIPPIVMANRKNVINQLPKTWVRLHKSELSAPQAPPKPAPFPPSPISCPVVEKRDVKLKGDLERFVRPIRVAQAN